LRRHRFSPLEDALTKRGSVLRHKKITAIQKKRFFHIPTWVIVLLFIVFTGLVIVELYFLFNMDMFDTITIGDVSYHRNMNEFNSALKMIKESLLVSIVVTLIASVSTGYLGWKRINGQKHQ
jgi:hypothetical protein